MITMNFNPKDY